MSEGQLQPDASGAVPQVSVVIPAWNRRGTLRMSVESVLRQTFTDFELIVVDDGSTDGTMAAIADITDPRLRRLAHETNKGVSAARNTGIRAARGEWMAFNDSDDEWLPLKLEKQMARLEGAGPEVVGCYTGMVDIRRPDDSRPRTVPVYLPDSNLSEVEGDVHTLRVGLAHLPVQSLMTRRDQLQLIGGFDEEIVAYEDNDCIWRLLERGSLLLVDEPLVLRNYSTNSIARDHRKMLRGWLRFIEKHSATLVANCPEDLTKSHIVYAGIQRRIGDLAGARASLAAAARLRPFSLPIRLRQLRLLGHALRRP